MKIFRQKQYTIQEGHYTGPKDMDKVPGALEVIGKSALAGSGIGAVVGGMMKDSSILSGAATGGKIGTVTGIILKFFLNYLHNPMTTVKFKNVDKLIRREFGIYRMSGITVGDSLDKRASVDEKFSFNSRNITDYKVTFCVQDNQVTMYTFGMSDQELQKTSDILDYYCKKYFGMEYSSSLLNRRLNAYSVTIVFTNYQVISNFIMELSNTLNTKINLMDNKALVDTRMSEVKNEDLDEKSFSFLGDLTKYDLMKIIGNGVSNFAGGLIRGSIGKGASYTIMGLLAQSLRNLSTGDIAKIPGITVNSGILDNKFLKAELKKEHYIENIHYSIGDPEAEVNVSLISGVFVITVPKGTEEDKKINSGFYKKFLSQVKMSESGNVRVYTYVVPSRKEFSFVLKTLMKLGFRINIFEK